jgi:putative ABC transport system permease protein
MIKPENAVQDSLEMMTLTVDHDYVETYGLDIIAGRDFSEDFATDATEAFLINESAARRLGWTEDPVGQKLMLQVWFQGEIRKRGTVVGVIRDFQYHSLRHAIEPMILHILPNSYYNDYLSVRLHPATPPRHSPNWKPTGPATTRSVRLSTASSTTASMPSTAPKPA